MIEKISRARELEAYLDIRNDIKGLSVGEGTLFYGDVYVGREYSNDHDALFLVNDYYMSRIPEIAAIVFRGWLGYVSEQGIPE